MTRPPWTGVWRPVPGPPCCPCSSPCSAWTCACPTPSRWKDKRLVVKGLAAALRKLNCAVAEVDHLDLRQRVISAVATVAGEGYHGLQVLVVERGGRAHARRRAAGQRRDHVRTRLNPMAKPSWPESPPPGRDDQAACRRMAEAEQADQPDALVTVTDVRVTEDLHHASVFFTVLGDEQQRSRRGLAGLLGPPGSRPSWPQQPRLRHAPDAREFALDIVPGQGARIDRLLAELGALERSGEPRRGAPVDQSPVPDQEGSGA